MLLPQRLQTLCLLRICMPPLRRPPAMAALPSSTFMRMSHAHELLQPQTHLCVCKAKLAAPLAGHDALSPCLVLFMPFLYQVLQSVLHLLGAGTL